MENTDKANPISVEEQLQLTIAPKATRNMAISVAEGVLDAVAMGMIPLNTVVTYFISDYVNSSFWIGLLPTLQAVFNALAQVMMAGKLRNCEKFRPYVTLGTTLFRTSWLVISLLILYFSNMHPLGFVCIFYAIYCFNGLCQGLTSLTYTPMMNKVIPNRIKGRFFGIRGAFNSGAGIIGAQIAGAILASGGDIKRFGILFMIAFVLDIISVFFQAAIWEPKVAVSILPNDAEQKRGYFADMKELMARDKNILNYVIAMFLITIGMSFFTFQTSNAKEALGLTGAQLGIITTIMYVGQTVGYVFWGWVADKKGYKLSLTLGQLGFVAYLLMAGFARDPMIVYIMTAVYGLSNSANMLGARNMVFKLCPYEQRVRYYAVVNMTLTIAAATASMLTGALIDWIGYSLSAFTCLLITVPGLLLLLRVREVNGSTSSIPITKR